MYHRDDAHTGYDPSLGTAFTATTGWVSPTLDESVYGEPLVYQGIVYVATLNNSVYALNQTDGTVVWGVHLRAPQSTGWSCGNVSPQGILGTPAIDPATGRIYVATFGSDDVYRLEGLNLTTGVEELDTVINSPTPGGFDWTIQQERGSLAVGNGYVYVPFGGRAGDCGAYHGWIYAVPTSGAAPLPPYETPGTGAGFWNAGGVVRDSTSGNVFETSGNGTSSGCDANPDGTPVYENDAVVAFSPTLTHLGAFIPQDWQANWCGIDEDLGSASMVLINPTLAFQAGKWGSGFLVNPQALGGTDGQLYPTPKPATYSAVDVCFGNHHDANFGSYAYAAPYAYLSCDGHGLVGLKVTTSAPVSFSACDATCAAPTWKAGGTTSFGPPIVGGGAVWAVSTGGGGLYGFDASTGAEIFHSGGFGATHFTTPSEAGGQIFVGSDNVVRSFNVVTGCGSVTLTGNPPSSDTVGSMPLFTAAAAGCPSPNPVYQFWTLAPGASSWHLEQAYSTTATFSWSTTGLAAGAYSVAVWARDANSAGAYGNALGRWDAVIIIGYNLGAASCTSLGISLAPPSSATVGTSVVFTANGTCPDPNPVFQFFVLAPGASAWSVVQPYSTANSFSWSSTGKAPGAYQAAVWVRDANSAGVYSNSFGTFDLSNSRSYSVTGCTGVSLSALPASTTSVGTMVNLSATASCPNPNPQFEFWTLAPGATSWTSVQAYSTTSTFGWSTAGKTPGGWQVAVWARDASSGGAYSNSLGTFD
ncbi:MAG TPA: PQQ-binding-like beta-propeller repeat protein, partial [Candidatus Dormibacteraeota bacterium]|nr:PQQ-binding-like beta-propeller repeat protein [Candidatus Dormibacteraeota bacterium]